MTMTPPIRESNGAPVAEFAGSALNVHRWASVGATYLSTVSIVTMAIAGWRAIESTRLRTEEINAQQRAFNRDLVSSIEDLAEKTGMLTSADYCPVRFRMRLADGGIPSRSVVGSLNSLEDDKVLEVGRFTSTDSGLLEFGLHPPGRYLLQLEMVDDLTLAHEFDLLPGVPVDRVVNCPSASQPDEVRSDVQVAVNWPAEFQSDDLLAIVEIEPAPFVSGDWVWFSAPEWPVHAIATNYVDSTSSEQTLRQLGLDDIYSPESILDFYSADAVPVSYRYCQIRAITFFHRSHDSQSRRRFHLLGALLYGESDGHLPDGARRWDAGDAPPLYEVNPSLGRSHWTIEIPPGCVDEIARHIQESSSAAESSI